MAPNNRRSNGSNNWFFFPMQDPLDIKIRQMRDKERKLEAMENALLQLKADVEAREQKLASAAEDIKNRQMQLELWANELQKKADRLGERESHLTEWDQAVKEAYEQTAAQAEQARQMERWQQSLEESAERYRQERTNWESTVGSMPESNYRQNIEAGMQSLTEHFGNTFREMQELRNQIRELSGAIQSCDWAAVEQLCELHRRLELLATGEALREADFLGAILKKYYNLCPIEPALGNNYSETHHERLHREQGGRLIIRCFSKGWASNDTVVRRALVDTADAV